MSGSKNRIRLLMGIGNELNGDDGVGCYVARMLDSPDWVTIDCATAPENFSGQVKRHNPFEVVVVDAALMGLSPGSLRRIDHQRIQEIGFSTHTMSLAHFVTYISEECSQVYLVGIEPHDTTIGSPLSEVVKQSAEELMAILLHSKITEIPSI